MADFIKIGTLTSTTNPDPTGLSIKNPFEKPGWGTQGRKAIMPRQGMKQILLDVRPNSSVTLRAHILNRSAGNWSGLQDTDTVTFTVPKLVTINNFYGETVYLEVISGSADVYVNSQDATLV